MTTITALNNISYIIMNTILAHITRAFIIVAISISIICLNSLTVKRYIEAVNMRPLFKHSIYSIVITLIFRVKNTFMLDTDYNLKKILALGAKNQPTCSLTVYVYKAKTRRWSCKPTIELVLYTMLASLTTALPLLVLIPIVCILIQRRHLLISLLALEAIILTLILLALVAYGNS